MFLFQECHLALGEHCVGPAPASVVCCYLLLVRDFLNWGFTPLKFEMGPQLNDQSYWRYELPSFYVWFQAAKSPPKDHSEYTHTEFGPYSELDFCGFFAPAKSMFDQLSIGCPLNILAVGWFRTMSDDVGCCWMMLMLDIGEAPQWTFWHPKFEKGVSSFGGDPVLGLWLRECNRYCTLLVNVSRHWFYAVWWLFSIQASWNLCRAIDNYPLEYHQDICMCQKDKTPPKICPDPETTKPGIQSTNWIDL